MIPAVVKAMRLGKVAKENGWHGDLESEVVGGQRITELRATRNDEVVYVHYTDNTMDGAVYQLFSYELKMHTASLVVERLQDWPDLLRVFKLAPREARPTLVTRYRSLPFALDEANEAIISKLIGQKLFWYSHEAAKLQCDVVLPPKGNQHKNYRIQDIGHRKMFHFIGLQAGFRSVLLDTLVKVG